MPKQLDDTYLRKSRGGMLEFPSFRLAELDRLCRILEISRWAATRFCRVLKVPLIYIGHRAYYNEFALERVIYVLTRVGGPGFAAPGSYHKNVGKKDVPVELDEDLQKQFEDPVVLMEMIAAQGRNMGPAAKVADLIKRLEAKREVSKSLNAGKNGHRSDKTTA